MMNVRIGLLVIASACTLVLALADLSGAWKVAVALVGVALPLIVAVLGEKADGDALASVYYRTPQGQDEVVIASKMNYPLPPPPWRSGSRRFRTALSRRRAS